MLRKLLLRTHIRQENYNNYSVHYYTIFVFTQLLGKTKLRVSLNSFCYTSLILSRLISKDSLAVWKIKYINDGEKITTLVSNYTFLVALIISGVPYKTEWVFEGTEKWEQFKFTKKLILCKVLKWFFLDKYSSFLFSFFGPPIIISHCNL